ncbi:e3 ubiquitin-protein ligase neurl1b-like [Stylonychia lemnae]|uniref:E3 ubiquitin-protein ligase neurl1b-like n=1 Tax=Stylonychia lemnae TaxID=5949 RepID=A0A078B3L0_STYLE|nr:e3 ubiquitin-protein ligase neurl1b-like [Stylonychia lemnae]|eukprot:CDW89039.1 e3 ubiquitin-protein ligase neurl1b-like [Stylonychia lemnae]
MNDSQDGQLNQPLFDQQTSYQDGRFSFIKVNDTIYLNQYIDRDFKSRPMPNSIRSNRNRAIVMMFVQMILSVISLVLYMRRKVCFIDQSYQIFLEQTNPSNNSDFILTLTGWVIWNSQSQHEFSFFACLFQMFLFNSGSKSSNNSDERLDDTWVLLLTSLPFLGIFIIGCHSMYLLNLIYDELKLRADQEKNNQKQQPKQIQFSEMNPIVLNSVVALNQQNIQNINHPVLGVSYGGMQQRDIYQQFREREAQQEMHVLAIPENNFDNKCIICLDKKKDSVFYPCGHECVCNTCGKEFMKIVRDKFCPMCRDRVKDLMKVYR